MVLFADRDIRLATATMGALNSQRLPLLGFLLASLLSFHGSCARSLLNGDKPVVGLVKSIDDTSGPFANEEIPKVQVESGIVSHEDDGATKNDEGIYLDADTPVEKVDDDEGQVRKLIDEVETASDEVDNDQFREYIKIPGDVEKTNDEVQFEGVIYEDVGRKLIDDAKESNGQTGDDSFRGETRKDGEDKTTEDESKNVPTIEKVLLKKVIDSDEVASAPVGSVEAFGTKIRLDETDKLADEFRTVGSNDQGGIEGIREVFNSKIEVEKYDESGNVDKDVNPLTDAKDDGQEGIAESLDEYNDERERKKHDNGDSSEFSIEPTEESADSEAGWKKSSDESSLEHEGSEKGIESSDSDETDEGENQDESDDRKETEYSKGENQETALKSKESIVDYQIKKLITIRDDAIGSVNEHPMNLENNEGDETDFLNSRKKSGYEEASDASNPREEVLGDLEEQPSEVRADNEPIHVGIFPDSFRPGNKLPPESNSVIRNNVLVQRLKEQAILLQGQILNNTLLQRFKEQTSEVLPELQKFTEFQLLATLKNITTSTRTEQMEDSYTNTMNTSELTKDQLEIIRSAEELLEEKERESFVSNVFNCIRGLNVLNCMRIFVWPIVADNIPETISQQFPTLPFEVNVPDLLQSSGLLPGRKNDTRSVAAGSKTESRVERKFLLTPEAVITNILRNTLEEKSKTDDPISSSDSISNEALISLLTSEQADTLKLAQIFLPVPDRAAFADRMYQCLKSYEYLGCMKYVAWPSMKEYFPTLDEFPNLQDCVPEGLPPIEIFPISQGPPGQYPQIENVDPTPNIATNQTYLVDASNPEDVIMRILQNVQEVNPKIAQTSSFTDARYASIANLVTPDQLGVLRKAEELLPPSVRPEFASMTMDCIREYDYHSCVKHSTWPTVRQIVPSLPEFPDIQSWIPAFPTFGSLPSYFPGLPDFSSYIPSLPDFVTGGLPGLPTIPGSSPQPAVETQPETTSMSPQRNLQESSESTEIAITDILTRVYATIPKIASTPSFIDSKDVATRVVTPGQLNIIRIAESILPDSVRPGFVAKIFRCVPEYSFVGCARDIIWPNLNEYISILPNFPGKDTSPTRVPVEESPSVPQNIDSKVLVRIFGDPSGETGVQRNGPVVTVVDTRFNPEQSESVILNNLRKIQSSLPKSSSVSSSSLVSRSPAFVNLLNDQQQNIVRLAESLLPEDLRPPFVTRMLQCVQESNFLACSRDVLWPVVTQSSYSVLSNFPNLLGNSTAESLPRERTETASTSGTATNAEIRNDSKVTVKSGEPGDATTTIIDTKFVPIINELPENVIANILRRAQAAVPNLSPQPSYLDTYNPSLAILMTRQQAGIIQLAENIIPPPIRSAFVTRMLECVRGNDFLSCTRHVAWPTVRQYLPSLPEFPHFQGWIPELPALPGLPAVPELPNVPEIPTFGGFTAFGERRDEAVDASSNSTYLNPVDPGTPETVIANILRNLTAVRNLSNTTSFVDPENPAVAELATEQQLDIIRMAEGLIRENDRPTFVDRMLLCIRDYNNFLSCTRHVAWPTIRQSLPSLPDFPNFQGWIPEFSGFPGIPVLQEVFALSEIPAYAGQPSGNFRLLTDEKPSDSGSPDDTVRLKSDTSATSAKRKRRSVVDLFRSFSTEHSDYEDEDTRTELGNVSRILLPNLTDSEFLEVLSNISKSKEQSADDHDGTLKHYFVETLNLTVRNSLSEDQLEILKFVEDLNSETSRRGFMSRVVRCIQSLSFIRCMGIFVWPIISNNLPSLPGFTTLASINPFGRSEENEAMEFFGMTSDEFETEMMKRKRSIEGELLQWYKSLVEDEFEKDLGLITLKGYGNGELGVSFNGFRDGRAKKIKDNKNMPSILTVISDIMEDIFEPSDKTKNVKKERSLDSGRADGSDYQILGDPDDELDAGDRVGKTDVTTDDNLIAMFLDRIKTNNSDYNNGEVGQFLSVDDAYNAFEVLFGTKLTSRIANRLKHMSAGSVRTFFGRNAKESEDEDSSNMTEGEARVVPLETSEGENDGMKRHKTDDKLKVIPFETQAGSASKKNYSKISLMLPRLDEELLPRKTTTSLIDIGRGLKMKMSQMIPGVGLVVSFLLQLALAHARAAASMAGMLSNMALGSAMFGMVRQAIFGPSTHPQIKYVYDNENVGEGIKWPHRYHDHRYARN